METKGPILSRRLSGVDAAFLYLESKETPLHIAGVCVFDGVIPFEKFIRNIDSKLYLLPRFRQIVVAPPYNAGYPTWEDYPQFDIRQHIFRARVEAPGGEAEFEALSGRILSQLMDRGKPLWDMHVIDGFEDGRGALIIRLHHSLADGISGAAIVMQVVMDSTEASHMQTRPPSARMRRRPAPQTTLEDAIASGIRSSLEHFIAAETALFELADQLLNDKPAMQGAAALLPEVVGSPPRKGRSSPPTIAA